MTTDEYIDNIVQDRIAAKGNKAFEKSLLLSEVLSQLDQSQFNVSDLLRPKVRERIDRALRRTDEYGARIYRPYLTGEERRWQAVRAMTITAFTASIRQRQQQADADLATIAIDEQICAEMKRVGALCVDEVYDRVMGERAAA